MMKKCIAIALILMLCGCGAGGGGDMTEPPAASPTVATEINTEAETTVSTSEEITSETEETTKETTTVIEETTTEQTVDTSAETSVTAEETTEAVTTAEEKKTETAAVTAPQPEKPKKAEVKIVDKEWSASNLFKCGLVPVRVPADPENPNNYDNSKYGYADKNGNIVIEPVWDTAWEFSDTGIAVVGIRNKEYKYKYGFIDTTGKVLVEQQFDNIASKFCYDSYNDITQFHEGYIRVVNYDYSVKDDWKGYTERLYFVDHQGNRVTDDYDAFWWASASPVGSDFSHGLAGVIEKSDKKLPVISYGKNIEIDYYNFSFINTSGDKVFTLDFPLYDAAKVIEGGSYPNYRVSPFNKYGWAVLDTEDESIGRQLISADGNVKPVSSEKVYGDGYYIEQADDKTVYLKDKNGKTVISGKAVMPLDDEHIAVMDDNGKSGILSVNGKWFYEPQFDKVIDGSVFQDTLCFVTMGNALYGVSNDMKTYLISLNADVLYDNMDEYYPMVDVIRSIALLKNGYSYSISKQNVDGKENLCYNICYNNELIYSGKTPVVYTDGYFKDDDGNVYSKSGKITLPENYYVIPAFNNEYDIYSNWK